MSTLAIYGDAGAGRDRRRPSRADGPPQMAGVARPWEQAVAERAADRLVVLRTGIVLDRGTPAFERLATLTRFGLGGRIGRGDQWVSWIHVDDFLRAVRFLCDQPAIDGVVHVTSPNPVQNRDMMAALRVAPSTGRGRRPHPSRSSTSARCSCAPTRPSRSPVAVASRAA